MNINRKSDLHQISDAVSCDSVFVALAQYNDFVSPVDLAIDLGGISVAIVRQRLQELGRCFAPSAPLGGASALKEGSVVENDGRDCWRVIKNTVFDVAKIDRQRQPNCSEGELSSSSTADLDEKDRVRVQAIKQEILDLSRKFFVEVGEKLKFVRDRQLYRFESKTFGAWCERELGMKRRYAYNLIDAFEVFQNVRNCTQNLPLPINECQIRPLAKLEPAEQIEVWTQAIADNNGKMPTGRKVQQIVRDLKESKMELPATYKVEQQVNTESNYPKLEIDAKYGKTERYLIPIKDEQLKQKIEQYARAVGAATLEGAIARLLEAVQDE